MESQQIKLPKPPTIEQKEPGEDKRRFSVVPFVAIWDRTLNPFEFRVLAALAGFANRAGVCYVSSYRLADMLKTTRPRVTRATSKLKQLGYVRQIGKPVLGVRGATLQIMFEPDMDIKEAVAIASRGSEEDLRPIDQIEEELAQMIADNEKQWTEEELKANKEKLAKMLLAAFKTPQDKPKLYEPVQGDTQAVKKIKQEIRSRMRQIRAEQFKEQAEQREKEPVSEQIPKHKILSLGAESGTGASAKTDTIKPEQVPKQAHKLGYEELVVYFDKHLFNGVKSESDLHMCSMLADRVSVAELERYLTAYSGETVTQIGNRMLGTGC